MSKTSEETVGLVSIGELAKSAGVSSRTIRYYEELGILPEPRRSAGGTRKYPSEYSGYIAATLALKDLGFRLDEIKPLARLALGRSVSAGQRDAAARLVEDRIEALARQVTVLRRLHDSVREPDAVTSVPAILGATSMTASTTVTSTGVTSTAVTTDRVTTDRVTTDRVATDRVATDRVAGDAGAGGQAGPGTIAAAGAS